VRRRHFLHAAAAAPLALHSTVWAAAHPDARFLLVFLRGGYDALSLLVPRTSPFYREVRPNIAVAGAAPLTDDWALHPVLASSLLPLAQRGQAVFVPFAGTDDTSRSHFETQDHIELGQGDGRTRDYGSGFMNRLAGVVGASEGAIAFTDQLPLAMRGRTEVANVSLKSLPRAGTAATQQAIAAMYRGTALQSRVEEAYAVRDEVAREMADEMEAAGRGAISSKGFELEARRVARLMRERYSLGFIDIGGWDTHVNQGAASGTLATRLDELGRGLAGFADEIGEPAWRRTVVVVVSEFGRTVRENGNRGTDHGHGSVYLVLGGALTGPVVAGEQVRLQASTLFQNRDLPVLNEYRAMLGGVFKRQFELGDAALDSVFPGARARDLGLV
jgi:uncharacterized protein (DUF1501 family)